MESHYEFNITLNGRHFFATHPRSGTTMCKEDVKNSLKLLREKFPQSEGYEVTVTYWKAVGHHLDL
jgi:hypothetical protein